MLKQKYLDKVEIKHIKITEEKNLTFLKSFFISFLEHLFGMKLKFCFWTRIKNIIERAQAFKLLAFSLGWCFASFSNRKDESRTLVQLIFPKLFVKIK